MRNFVGWIITLVFLSVSVPVIAGNVLPPDEQKSRIIKYLISTVKWPCCSIPKQEFSVCLLGKFENPEPFKSLSGNTIKDYKVAVKSIANAKESLNCQIVCIAESEKANVEELKKMHQGKPTILLADFDHFALKGGSMNFTLIKHTVALTVNIETLKASNIQFDLKEYNRITVVPREEDLD